MRVYVTKYTLTTGSIECLAAKRTTFSEMVKTNVRGYISKPHWHTELAAAEAQVRKMVAAKLRSLEKARVKTIEIGERFAPLEPGGKTT